MPLDMGCGMCLLKKDQNENLYPLILKGIYLQWDISLEHIIRTSCPVSPVLNSPSLPGEPLLCSLFLKKLCLLKAQTLEPSLTSANALISLCTSSFLNFLTDFLMRPLDSPLPYLNIPYRLIFQNFNPNHVILLFKKVFTSC